jgi:predicted dehydrogenase
MRFAAIGLDHRHIYHLVEGLLDAGLSCAGYWPQSSDPRVLKGFRERFPDLVAVADRDALMRDPAIDIICCAAIPFDRAAIAIEAMRNGKDVMVDKPGVITADAFERVQQAVRKTGRIFSICFSERLIVPAAEVAGKLIAEGAIGHVIQTVGLGPHRFNRAIRPAWFFDPAQGGGILTDIASHQIEQFMFYTGSEAPEIVASTVGKFGTADFPDFQDFGEILLRSERASGYVRVDWFTPDGLPSWGDGRLTILGTDGTIELRKNLDIEGRAGTDHLFLADHRGTRYVDCSKEPLSYFNRFAADVRNRTQTAMTQSHVFTVCRLSLEAQARAGKVGARRPSHSL